MWSRGEMDITLVFGTKIWGSSPYEIANKNLMIKKNKIFWISSYPKSGNTWLRFIICGLFFTKDGMIRELEIVKKIPKFDSLNNFKFIKDISLKDYNLIFRDKEYDENTLITYSKYWLQAQQRIKLPDHRLGFFKTHNARIKLNATQIPYTNELTTQGFIYISRDPRDVVLSYSKHTNNNIDSTINILINDKIMGKKKIDNRMPEIITNWKDHYRSWKSFESVPNLFLRYEDLVFDIEKEINKIIDFFKKNFSISIDNKKEKIINIIKSTKFNNLKNIEKKEGFFEKSEYSNFFRNGNMNQWKKKLNSNQKKIIIKYFEKQMIDLKYI